MIRDELVSFIQSIIKSKKKKKGDLGKSDWGACDGGHQVSNFKEAFEIPEFPVCCLVTVSISWPFTRFLGRWHLAITCTTGSLRFMVFLAEPCKACRMVGAGWSAVGVAYSLPSSPGYIPCYYRQLPPVLRVVSMESGNMRSRHVGNSGSTRQVSLLLGGLNVCESCGWSEFWVLEQEALDIGVDIQVALRIL